MLARCTIPVSGLLRARPVISMINAPMISPNTNEIVAYINVDVRLALPISELYRLFLQRYVYVRGYKVFICVMHKHRVYM